MNMLNKYLQKYALLIFALITLILIFTREPFFDEIHAYDIAYLKLNEIFYLTRIEGHPVLWYLFLKLSIARHIALDCYENYMRYIQKCLTSQIC